MKKITVLGVAFCLIAVLSVSAWAADIPGQKLTPNELASVTGKFSPVSVPVSFFQNLSSTGTTVFINGEKAVSSSPIYTVGGITVVASATFRK